MHFIGSLCSTTSPRGRHRVTRGRSGSDLHARTRQFYGDSIRQTFISRTDTYVHLWEMRFSQENRSSIYTFLRFSSSSRNTRHSRGMAQAIKKSRTTRVDFIVTAQLPFERHVGGKKERQRWMQVTCEHLGTRAGSFKKKIIIIKWQKEGGGSKKTTSHNISFLVWVGPVTIPVLAVRSERRSNGSDHTSSQCRRCLGGRRAETHL